MSLAITVNGRLAFQQTIPGRGGALTIDVTFRRWRGARLKVAFSDGATLIATEVAC